MSQDVTPAIRALHFKYTGQYSSDEEIKSWYQNYISGNDRPYIKEK